jgi:hypothetical protein
LGILDADRFNLYYFKNYSECIENFKSFAKDLGYFNLVKDEIWIILFKKQNIDKNTTLEVSKFNHILKDKLKTKFKKEGGPKLKGEQKRLKFLFDECSDHLVIKLLNDEIFLPINELFNLEYYLNKIFDIVYKTAELHQHKLDKINQEENKINSDCMKDMLDQNIYRLQLEGVKQLCDSVYLHKHLSQLLGRELETLDDYKIC